MKRLFFIILLIPVILTAQEAFLDMNAFSFGEAAGGNCYSGIVPSAGNIFYNPAVAAGKSTSILYEHKFLFDNISSYNAAAVSIPLTYSLNTGVGYINQNIEDIPIYPEFPSDPDSVNFEPLGYFSDNAHAFFVNISYTHIPSAYAPYEITGGINVKYIIHSIYTSTGMGTGIDAGLSMLFYMNRINHLLNGRAVLFVAGNDVGATAVKWNTVSEHTDSRPYTAVAGIGYSVDVDEIKSAISAELNGKFGKRNGAGFSADIMFNDIIGIFSGINYEKGYDAYMFNFEGAGIRIYFAGFELMYSMSGNDIGLNHSITAGYSL